MRSADPATETRTADPDRPRRTRQPVWRALLCLLALQLCAGAVLAQDHVAISVSTPSGLRNAIVQANLNPATNYIIYLEASMDLDELMDTGSALPPIAGTVTLARGDDVPSGVPVQLRGGGMGSNFRLLEVANGGYFITIGVELVEFSSSANGGCIAVNQGGRINTNYTAFRNCISGGDGGAIYVDDAEVDLFASAFTDNTATRGGAIAVEGDEKFYAFAVFSDNSAMEGGAIYGLGRTEVENSIFRNNHASLRGGAVSLRGRTIIKTSVFDDNTAGIAGCDVNVNASSADATATLRGNHLDGDSCTTQREENPFGLLRQMHNTVYGPPPLRLLNSTGDVDFLGNVMASGSGGYFPALKSAVKTLCADFGSGAFHSLGANVATDDSCALTHPNDLVTATPGLLAPDADGIRGITTSSPAVDRGPSGLVFLPTASGVEPVLPCGYRDVRGLGRPQDGDGDGEFECDSGAVELQGGPDIGSAQTAAYYDAGRSGEGVFVDMIGNGLATVSVFSYGPNGGMAWFTGLGQVVGNSVVIDNLDITSGGRFGAAFNANAITRQHVGGLSLVFPDCEAGGRPGRMVFDPALDAEFEPLSVRAQRLTRVVPCSGAPGPFAGLSGGWYAPERSGEGVFLQFQPDGSVVVVFYSYTPDGELFWAIAGDASFDGTTLTASMLYPAGTTRFGSNFNASEVDLQPWGTITMRFTGCGTADFGWNATVAGYGSGGFAYVRLTQPSDTVCPF